MWQRRSAALLVIGLAAGWLTGCASLGLPGLGARTATAQDASRDAAAAEIAVFKLDVQAPDALRPLLITHLDLARFQSAPAAADITANELERLMRAAPAQARELLETEGYFNAEVSVARVPDRPDAALPQLRMQVDPGPRSRVATLTFSRADNAGNGVADVGNEPNEPNDPDAAAALASARQWWSLPAGAAFSQSAWSDAKTGAVTRLRAEGFAAARWSAQTRARVDASSQRVDLQLVLDSGPRYRVGALQIEGLARYDAAAVRRLADFNPGAPYTEKLLLDFQDRLQKVGLFEGASVEIDADPATAQAAPVRVRVKELNLQQATAGIGYSANTGQRLSLEHFHRRVFGLDWIARNKIEYGPLQQSWEGELLSHPRDGLYRNLMAGSALRLNAADQQLLSWKLRVGRTQDTPRIERLYFAELTHAQLTNATLTNVGDAASLNYQWVLRDLDNVLLPTRGVSVSAQVAAGHARGTQTVAGAAAQEASGPFGRAYSRLTWYRPFGAWFGSVRLEAGEVFTRDLIGVPDTLLFRAGGDDSVRGYGYRTLGPVVAGAVISARTLLTGSVEVAHPISRAYPAFQWAAFVDAGQAADRWTDLHPVFGYGAGVRWRSPVGPLKLDLAYGAALQKFRLHFSIGIAF